ncbi:hypothetical protein A9P82_13030 [Arachidicoccus ginsenosidimutans]|uniref:hypothetical protein n=1 Tax=Arachidicoccus sp. BS20 TaxID=1850526 RepID=UPI0007F16C43|nr:hypothetical protein [Arachidicoccus sp. BS20]ANI90126.1 hypothetical protein A9P82_13030 [Arachidicoccus sp. BS20]
MTHKELAKRFTELLNANPIHNTIAELFNKALDCGALNIQAEPAADYRLPKIIFYAILCTMADDWQPYHESNKKEAKNLKLFL